MASAENNIVSSNKEATFDYATVPSTVADDLHAAAARIQHLERSLTHDVVEIGKELIAVKAKLEHGAFGKWLAAEFRWSDRTARNYMRVAEWGADKTETISDLPPSIVYMLASPSTPTPACTEVISRINSGEKPTEWQIKEVISEAKFRVKRENYLKDQAERAKALSARQRKRRAEWKSEDERLQKENEQRRADAATQA